MRRFSSSGRHAARAWAWQEGEAELTSPQAHPSPGSLRVQPSRVQGFPTWFFAKLMCARSVCECMTHVCSVCVFKCVYMYVYM